MRCFIRSLAGLVALAMPLSAQQPVMRLTLGGGAATDLRGVRAGAYVLAPSATLFPSRNIRLALHARGTRFRSREWSIAGGAAADARLPVSTRVAFVLGVSGDLTRTSYRATYLHAEALPALELRLGSLTAWGGARGAGARTTLPDGSPVPLPDTPGSGAVERSTFGPAFGASISVLRFGPGEEVRIAYREDHGRVDGKLVVDRLATATMSRGRVALSGTVGARRAPGKDRAYGGARLAVAVTRWIALFGGAETYPSNPLLDTQGGRSVSAGLSFSSGGIGRGPSRGGNHRGPRPAGVNSLEPGLTRLSIEAGKAGRVEVAGDWNQWRPIVLARTANGVWYADLAIPPGEYRYAFRIDGTSWDVPKGVAAVNDGFGGRSAWLSVGTPERK